MFHKFFKLLICVVLLTSFATQAAAQSAVILAVAQAAASGAYDAEDDIGLVADDPSDSTANANSTKLTAALQAQWEGGEFTFANGTTGPVLKPIVCSAKAFFFRCNDGAAIKTSRKMGGALFGFGARSYPFPENGYSDDSQGGAVTRFILTDGDGGEAFIRLRGTGFVLAGIEFHCLRWTGDEEVVNTVRPNAVIQVEGRDEPSSGKHVISNVSLFSATYGIQAVNGYYEDNGSLNSAAGGGNGVHADECIVSSVYCNHCDSFFRSDNEQAVGWSFRDIYLMSAGVSYPMIAFDMQRGGKIYANHIILNLPTVTLLRCNYPSSNYNRYVIEDFQWDNFDYLGNGGDGEGVGQRLTLYDLVYNSATADWFWNDVRISGHMPNDYYPRADLVKINTSLGTSTAMPNWDKILFDVTQLPVDDLEDTPMFTEKGTSVYPIKDYFAPNMQ